MGVLAAALASLAVTGCGRTVAVQPLPIASEQTRAACAQLIDELPSSITAGRAWQVSPDPESTAAWGTPAVVLRCGEEGQLPEPTDQLLSINDLTWLVTPLTDGELYSAVDRFPAVEVTVPADYRPSAEVIAELTPAVAAGTTAS